MVLLFFQLPTSSSHTGDDMEEEDDMEDGDLEDLDGEGLNEPFFLNQPGALVHRVRRR